VHSYAPDLGVDAVGAAEHGRAFAAVVARDNVFATQFHPEKSGEAGLQLYANIVREVAA
jgi:imidazole glycerol-phosphate synthase subunit HisH